MVTFCSKKVMRLFPTPEYRKLSFSFPPDVGFFLVFPVLLRFFMILEVVFLGIAGIFEVLLILLPDICSLQMAWLLSSGG